MPVFFDNIHASKGGAQGAPRSYLVNEVAHELMDLSFESAGEAPIIGAEIDIVVVGAKGLVAKDHSLFKKAASNAYYQMVAMLT